MSVVMDLCSRKIVGWHVSEKLDANLVTQALKKAVRNRSYKSGKLIFHSDRGSQYGSKKMRTLLRNLGILQSMSGKANPYENAWTESLIGTIKLEMNDMEKLEDIYDAKSQIHEYIEGYYNPIRRHSKLDYQSPNY